VKVWFDSRKDTHMTTTNLVPRKPLHSQDIAVWPDGTWTELGDVWNGEYHFMSDDYEVVSLEDHIRLKALGIDEEML
jgi:hypothetical protein